MSCSIVGKFVRLEPKAETHKKIIQAGRVLFFPMLYAETTKLLRPADIYPGEFFFLFFRAGA